MFSSLLNRHVHVQMSLHHNILVQYVSQNFHVKSRFHIQNSTSLLLSVKISEFLDLIQRIAYYTMNISILGFHAIFILLIEVQPVWTLYDTKYR